MGRGGARNNHKEKNWETMKLIIWKKGAKNKENGDRKTSKRQRSGKARREKEKHTEQGLKKKDQKMGPIREKKEISGRITKKESKLIKEKRRKTEYKQEWQKR